MEDKDYNNLMQKATTWNCDFLYTVEAPEQNTDGVQNTVVNLSGKATKKIEPRKRQAWERSRRR